jgi:hypothetical protein
LAAATEARALIGFLSSRFDGQFSWLTATTQASADGYINFDSATQRFSISPEQALILADENGPAFFPAMFEIAAAAVRALPKVEEAFRTGAGVGWHEHDSCLFAETERFFRPGYATHLVSEWIPALEGVKEKLEQVADVGCGHGASTILLAKAFSKSQFSAFDYHEPPLARASWRAQRHRSAWPERLRIVGLVISPPPPLSSPFAASQLEKTYPAPL